MNSILMIESSINKQLIPVQSLTGIVSANCTLQATRQWGQKSNFVDCAVLQELAGILAVSASRIPETQSGFCYLMQRYWMNKNTKYDCWPSLKWI